MRTFLWLVAGALVVWVGLRAIRNNRTPIAGSLRTSSYPPASTSDDLLNSFFRVPTNYANQPETRVFSVVGRPKTYDDWDWGRLVYYWKGRSISVRVIVQGGTVICAELIDPEDNERFAESIQVLWERSGDHLG